jgi:hypothetical protein
MGSQRFYRNRNYCSSHTYWLEMSLKVGMCCQIKAVLRDIVEVLLLGICGVGSDVCQNVTIGHELQSPGPDLAAWPETVVVLSRNLCCELSCAHVCLNVTI